MLNSSLCDYSDAYILVKGTITVQNTAAVNNVGEKEIFKNSASFTNCKTEINNTEVDNAKDIDIAIPMYNLIEHSDNYSRTSGYLWQYCEDIPAINNNGDIIDFNGANVTDLFNFNEKITGQTGDNGTKDVEIMVPLKCLSNFWRTLEMALINCGVNLGKKLGLQIVTVSTADANQGATFSITDTKLYVPVVTLSTQDNAKLLQQLK